MGHNNGDLERGPSGAPFRVKADLKELRRRRESGVERGRQVFLGDPCRRGRESAVGGGRRRAGGVRFTQVRNGNIFVS